MCPLWCLTFLQASQHCYWPRLKSVPFTPLEARSRPREVERRVTHFAKSHSPGPQRCIKCSTSIKLQRYHKCICGNSLVSLAQTCNETLTFERDMIKLQSLHGVWSRFNKSRSRRRVRSSVRGFQNKRACRSVRLLEVQQSCTVHVYMYAICSAFSWYGMVWLVWFSQYTVKISTLLILNAYWIFNSKDCLYNHTRVGRYGQHREPASKNTASHFLSTFFIHSVEVESHKCSPVLKCG